MLLEKRIQVLNNQFESLSNSRRENILDLEQDVFQPECEESTMQRQLTDLKNIKSMRNSPLKQKLRLVDSNQQNLQQKNYELLQQIDDHKQ